MLTSFVVSRSFSLILHKKTCLLTQAGKTKIQIIRHIMAVQSNWGTKLVDRKMVL